MQSEDEIRFELEAAAVAEVTPREKSKYYLRSHEKFANFKDFDTNRMIEDFSKEFPTVPKKEIQGMVMQAIYWHYLR
jgi:hypothetical protein